MKINLFKFVQNIQSNMVKKVVFYKNFCTENLKTRKSLQKLLKKPTVLTTFLKLFVSKSQSESYNHPERNWKHKNSIILLNPPISVKVPQLAALRFDIVALVYRQFGNAAPVTLQNVIASAALQPTFFIRLPQEQSAQFHRQLTQVKHILHRSCHTPSRFF